MAFQAVSFKDGNVRWLRTSETVPLGKRELGDLAINRYILKKEIEVERAKAPAHSRLSGLQSLFH